MPVAVSPYRGHAPRRAGPRARLVLAASLLAAALGPLAIAGAALRLVVLDRLDAGFALLLAPLAIALLLGACARAGLGALDHEARDRREAQAALLLARDIGEAAREAAGIGAFEDDAALGVTSLDAGGRALLADADGGSWSGRAWTERVHPEERPGVEAARAAALAGSARLAAEFRLAGPGAARWLRVVARPPAGAEGAAGPSARLVGVLYDVTERREREARAAAAALALKEANDRLALAHDAARIGAFDQDLVTGAVRVTGRWRELFGLADNDDGAMGDAWLRAVHPEDRARVERGFLDTAADGHAFAEEFRVVAPAGDHATDAGALAVRWLFGRGESVAGQGGAAGRRVGVVMDVTERKRVEAVARDSERSVALAVEATQLGLFDWSPHLPRFKASGAFARVFGWSEAEAYAVADFFDALHPDDRPGVERALVAATESAGDGRYSAEYRIRSPGVAGPVAPPDGWRWVNARGQALFEGEGEGRAVVRFVGTVLDVTERRLAEEAARAGEARLRELIDHLNAFVAVLDTDGTVREANAAPVDAMGLAREEVVGRPYWESPVWSADPATVERVREAVASAAAGTTARVDADGRTATGGLLALDLQVAPLRDAAGRVRGLVASALDVTERKRAEAAMLDERRRFERIALATPALVYVHDLDERRNLYTNRGLGESLGYPPGAVRDDEPDGVRALLHPDDAARFPEGSARLRSLSEGEVARREYRMRGADGAYRWFIGQDVVFARGADGRARQVIGAALDVTDAREREERIRFLMREVAHRTKNLLAIVASMARQTVKASRSAADFEARFSARLQGLAGSQDILTREDWAGAGIRDLARAQIAPYADPDGPRVVLVGPEVRLRPEPAQNLGLALHELASNAARHGALSAPGGSVELRWGLADGGDGGPARLDMAWTERGGPVVVPPRVRGFGALVVERIAPTALSGTADLDYAAGGVAWRLSMPVAEVVAGPLPAGAPRPAASATGVVVPVIAGPLAPPSTEVMPP